MTFTHKQYTPEELAEEANKRNGTDQIKVGDHVRLKYNDEYLGKVAEEYTVRYVRVQNGDGVELTLNIEHLELAPRLAPDEAWNELPFLVLKFVNSYMSHGIARLSEYNLRTIRRECYKLLGGAGIKVDESVKARVRKTIERVSYAMGIDLA